MITVNRAYEEKEVTLMLDISTGKPMTKEDALKYYEDNLNEYVLTYYLLKVYDKSKIYDHISILEYETENFYSYDLNQKQKSSVWEVVLKVEFLAYFDWSSKTYLDRASFERNYNNGDKND